MDVGAWLRGLGLGQYETAFRESEIDAEVLPDLTDSDLNQLGLPLGHRKRLLKAIAALGTGETAVKPPSSATSPPGGVAERRPITVMFCDLVGSTSMAATLDAEDWRNLVNSLSRRSVGGGERDRWPCVEKAGRRADGAVRLSSGAGERRRAGRARRALDPARACRNQRQKRQQRRPGTSSADRP